MLGLRDRIKLRLENKVDMEASKTSSLAGMTFRSTIKGSFK